MEFRFDLQQIFNPGSHGVAIIDSRKTFMRQYEVNQVIDRMGEASARAQGLGSIITTANRFFCSPDNKLYLKVEKNTAIGFLKIGYRRLFYSDHLGAKEINPLCLLDFYVHEDMQRHGFGQEIYEVMLREERISPNKIAIDKPSNKLIRFMHKHYNLADFTPQHNNFVIYKEFFSPYYSFEEEECLDSEQLRSYTKNEFRLPNTQEIKQTKLDVRPSLRTTNDSYGREWHQHQGYTYQARERKMIEQASNGLIYDDSKLADQPTNRLFQKQNTLIPPPWAVSESSRRINTNTTSSTYGSFCTRLK